MASFEGAARRAAGQCFAYPYTKGEGWEVWRVHEVDPSTGEVVVTEHADACTARMEEVAARFRFMQAVLFASS